MKFTTCPEFETDLQTLALTAQVSPPRSKERRLALKQLVERIMQSGCLCKPQIGNFSPPIYEEIYAEAVQDLLLFVCRKIDQYDSSRGTILAWINMLLSRRFIKEAIPKVLNHTQVSNLALPDLDQFLPPQVPPSLVEELMAYIDADPNGDFRMAYIRYHPTANFQYLFRRRLAGDSWEAIAQDLNLSISTISSFFYRCITRFSDQIREQFISN